MKTEWLTEPVKKALLVCGWSIEGLEELSNTYEAADDSWAASTRFHAEHSLREWLCQDGRHIEYAFTPSLDDHKHAVTVWDGDPEEPLFVTGPTYLEALAAAVVAVGEQAGNTVENTRRNG